MALVSQSFVAPHCPVVVQVIEAAFPEHAILGEEGGVAGNTASEYLWFAPSPLVFQPTSKIFALCLCYSMYSPIPSAFCLAPFGYP